MNRTLTHEFKNQWSWTSILSMTGQVQTFSPQLMHRQTRRSLTDGVQSNLQQRWVMYLLLHMQNPDKKIKSIFELTPEASGWKTTRTDLVKLLFYPFFKLCRNILDSSFEKFVFVPVFLHSEIVLLYFYYVKTCLDVEYSLCKYSEPDCSFFICY